MTEILPDIPEPDSKDQIRKVIVAALGPIPGASLIADLVLASPFQDRLIDWLRDFAEKFERLCERVESIDSKTLVKDEAFRTTFFNAMRLVTYTHRKEKHEMLRNAVLNSALPDAPVDDERTVFLNLVEEFSVLHMLVLKTFRHPGIANLSGFSIDDGNWRNNAGVFELFEFIQKEFPEIDLGFDFYVHVLSEFHTRELISNTHSKRGEFSRMSHHPELTTFGHRFLKFIESPLDN